MKLFHSFSYSLVLAWLIQLFGFRSVQAASSTSLQRRANNRYDRDFFKFVTRPDIKAPRWDIKVHDREAISPGYWVLAPYAMLDQTSHGDSWVGPHIYNGEGELIWSGAPLFGYFNIYDFKVTQMGGRDVLTAIYEHGDGGMILDSNYRVPKIVDWPQGYRVLNMHDFNLIKDGSRALIMTKGHHNVTREMADSIGWAGDCYVHSHGLLEVDISTLESQALFSWNATDVIGLDETTYGLNNLDKKCMNGWDIHHFNAIDQFPDGDYLISGRHTDAIYKISHHDGSVVWRLGGVKSDFEFIGNALFSRQHHARVHGQNETHVLLSLFDNAKGDDEPKSNDYSRGLILSLNTQDMTAETIQEYIHPHHHIVNSRGSTQILPNSNVFISWTYNSLISEHTEDGKILLEAQLPSGKNTYRAYKYPWVGRPAEPPDVYSAANNDSGTTNTSVYVSWNGATEVAQWNFYETDSQGRNYRLITSKLRDGFETSVSFEHFSQFVVAEALDQDDRPLGKSKVVETVPPGVEQKVWHEAQQWRAENAFQDSADAEPSLFTTSLAAFMGAFVCGALFSASVCGMIWAARLSKRGSWRRSRNCEYEPLWKSKEEADLEVTEEDSTKHR